MDDINGRAPRKEARAAKRLTARMMNAVTVLTTQLKAGTRQYLGSSRMRSPLPSLVVAGVAVSFAVIVRMTLLTGLGTRLAYLTFSFCVAVAALVGGFWAGAIASLFAALIASLWVTPPVDRADWLGLLTFFISCALIAGVTGAMHRARRRAVRAEEETALLPALKRAETPSRMLIEHAPISIAMFDRNMNYIATSRRWINEFGRGYDELIGLNHYDVHSDLPERWKEVHRRAQAGESVDSDNDVWVQDNGAEVWLRWAAYPWVDAQGQIGGIIISTEDITRQTLADRALKADLESLTRLTEVSQLCGRAANDYTLCLDAILDAGMFLAGANKGNIQLLDRDSGALVIVAQRGFESPFLSFFACADSANSACGVALRSGRRELVQDVRLSEIYPQAAREAVLAAEVCAVLSTPLVSSTGQVMGIISTYFSQPNPSLGEGELRRMDLLARQAADFLERRQATIALEDREARLQAVFDAATDAILTINDKGVMQSVNAAAVRLFGYEAGELIGQNVNMLMDEPHRTRHYDYIRHYLETGESRIIGRGRELEAIHKDGTPIPVELAVGKVEDGRILFVGIVRDISERKRASMLQQALMDEVKLSEAQARERQALFQSVFDSAPEGIILTNLDGDIVTYNAALRRTFGYEKEELVGSPITVLFEKSVDYLSVPASPSEHGEWRGAVPEDCNCKRKSGEIFPAEVIKTRYLDGAGEPTGYLRIIRDVTWERKQQEDLRKAQRLEAIGRLTGGVAHDFNNILTVVSGNLQLLEMRLQHGGLKRYIVEAERAVDMGVRLNQRLMTFARQRRLEPELSDLNKHVNDMLELLRRTLGEHIKINAVLADNLSPTVVDPSEIESAILNLALNARDAMPTGGTLVIETRNVLIDDSAPQAREELPAGSYVRLSVSDTGSGMPPNVLARAFEPFFTTKEPGKGTGLGLASLYGFVKQSGGHVTLHSEVGRGTTINMYLPSAGKTAQTEISAPVSPRPVEGAGETILVVEDNSDVRRVVVERLAMLGYRTIEAEEGDSALAALHSGASIDLVFSDVVMPGGMSGFELAAKIRELWPSQKLLLTSGFTGDVAQQGRQAIEGTLMLRKPYGQLELSRMLRAALIG